MKEKEEREKRSRFLKTRKERKRKRQESPIIIVLFVLLWGFYSRFREQEWRLGGSGEEERIEKARRS